MFVKVCKKQEKKVPAFPVSFWDFTSGFHDLLAIFFNLPDST